MDKDLLQAISQMMDEKLKPINDRLDSMEDKIDKLQEDAQITRAGVNSLLDWAEECGNVIKFPLPRVK